MKKVCLTSLLLLSLLSWCFVVHGRDKVTNQ